MASSRRMQVGSLSELSPGGRTAAVPGMASDAGKTAVRGMRSSAGRGRARAHIAVVVDTVVAGRIAVVVGTVVAGRIVVVTDMASGLLRRMCRSNRKLTL